MDTKAKLCALGLALMMVAAAAGTGWALQLPLTATVDLGPAQAPRVATPAETPLPSWPRPALKLDEDASVHTDSAARASTGRIDRAP
ncbi:hypothetical protein [uncultured Azohydromonas sp.]|jgi:hypothetical protein|uniref:hypothetical protein n=1 Tax=uncultured Azohydromonas sp. TaxID=487342 RepID=UPI0026176B64|nr:hypothetical protein [uncultured Azohydromonas sp.]